MQRLFLALSMMVLLPLTGCGEVTSDRALSGAGIGAAVGTIGSAVAGGAILPGLLVGGAVGAATGAITTPSEINLGKPIWEN